MPKIDVNENLFFSLLGEKPSYDKLEILLQSAKAELDELPTEATGDERILKIELNDTNRPDLWSTAGVARALRTYRTKEITDYRKLFSGDCGNRVVKVSSDVKKVRPFMTAFVVSGKPIDDAMLKDIIQTQEKLCWNFGRKRQSVSMGVYRSEKIHWPVHYTACDPDKTSFVPLATDTKMTCRQIITEHPKGKEFGWILKDAEVFPILKDDKGEILSMAPIINSADLGAVQVGDTDLMIEFTGCDLPSILLATQILACDFIDAGYKILPIKMEYEFDTEFGKDFACPIYFQKPISADVEFCHKLLGENLSNEEIEEALLRMGIVATISDGKITCEIPPYRNDFLHPADVAEDVMIGRGLSSFSKEKPRDFTIGRLLPITELSRKTKMLLVGQGYQEMIFNYLGSKLNFIDKMNFDGSAVIEISNPMTENYQFVRPSVLPSLLGAESTSANAVYPHKIFEIGKVAYICDEENTGCRTRQVLGMLSASAEDNFNTMASEVASLLFYLGFEYAVEASSDSRFIPGRQVKVLAKKGDKQVVAGIFGEIHPAVLENWQITMPCVAAELDLEELISAM